MTHPTFFRRIASVALCGAVSLSITVGQDQGGGGGAQAGGQAGAGASQGGGARVPGNTGGVPGGTTRPDPTRPSNQPPFGQESRTSPFEMPRQIYLQGKVMMEDGTPPPEPVTIERVCAGIARPEGHTNSKGHFSFALGQNQAMMMDASVANNDPIFGSASRTMTGQQRGVSERELMGCELRASLPGFQSQIIQLSGRRALDNPDVGTIVLRRLGKVEGFTFSGTSAYAPKDARKAYEKGREALKKSKHADAEKELTKAVELYPKYAVAWYELGVAYQQQMKVEEARRAYGESLKADGKYVNPYAQLARIATAEKKWKDAAEYSNQLLKLNPYFSPEVYFYSAIANYNLQQMDVAEEHAREAVKMDAQHRNPKSNHLLGVILAQKEDFPGAVENMRAYLKFAPQAQDAEIVKKQLADIEKMASAKQDASGRNAQQ